MTPLRSFCLSFVSHASCCGGQKGTYKAFSVCFFMLLAKAAAPAAVFRSGLRCFYSLCSSSRLVRRLPAWGQQLLLRFCNP